MHLSRRSRRSLTAFTSGVIVASIGKIIASATGADHAFATAASIVALFGFVFAWAFFTGVNLGMPLAIKDARPGEGHPVNSSSGWSCILFSLGVLLATAILA